MPKYSNELEGLYQAGFTTDLSLTFNHADLRVKLLIQGQTLAVVIMNPLLEEEASELGVFIDNRIKHFDIVHIIYHFNSNSSPRVFDCNTYFQFFLTPFKSVHIQIIKGGALKFAAFETGYYSLFFPQNLAEAIHFTSISQQERDILFSKQKLRLDALYNKTSNFWNANYEISTLKEDVHFDKLVVDCLNFPVWMVDKDYHLVHFNASYKLLYEQITKEFPKIGATTDDNLPLEFQLFIKKIYQTVWSGGKVSKQTIWEIAGKPRNLFFDAVPVKNPDGNIHYAMVYVSDRTDFALANFSKIGSKTTENTLSKVVEDENLYKFLLDHTSDVIVMVDEFDIIQYTSPSIQTVYGYHPKDVQHKNAFAFIHPFDYEAFRIALSSSSNTNQTTSLHTVRVLNRTGQAVWSDLNLHRIVDAQGQYLKGIFCLRDVSNRVAKEESFRINEKLLETISKNVREGLFRVNPQMELLFINDAFKELLGYMHEPLHLIGKASLFQSESERDRLLKLVLHQGYIQNEEVEMRRKDGTIFTVQMSAIKTENETGKLFIDGVIRDISAQKQAERIMLEAKEAAERANKLKAEFLASVSHEIRTPLNGVIGMTSLLKHTALSEEQKDYVDTIKKSGDHLLSIINDILDFSKIESGYLLTESYPFELSVIMEETLDLFAAKAYEKNIELIIDVAENVNEYYLGDATRIRQILVNLIGNALKFTEHGEIITKVSLAENQSGNSGEKVKLKFSVSDSGIGIKEQDIDRLFKPFSQVDSSNTRKFGGTGLGLVISEKLVKAMGGEIYVESQYGFGTTFHFTLLLEDHQQTSKKEIDFGKLNGLTAMVVDDNLTNLKIVDRVLSQKGMHVITTPDPHLGLNTLNNSGLKIDILIIDMQMPEIDGLEFGTMIRKQKHTSSIPMILFSSIGDFHALDKQTQLVFNGILTKPAKPSVILSKIMQVLYKETPLKQSLSETRQLSEDFANQYPSRILIAEDNLINQKLIVKILEKMGYHADVVANGLEVLESVTLKPYDLIFMDVQMPEMDGLEATRHLSRKRMIHKPNVVAMTANALAGDRENCLAAGMQDYISKPVKIEEIQKMIIKWGTHQ